MVILALTPQQWVPGAGGRGHVPTAASCQVGCDWRQFCLVSGVREGIIPFSPTSETGVLFCCGVPLSEEKGKSREEQCQEDLILPFPSQPCVVLGTVCPRHHLSVLVGTGCPVPWHLSSGHVVSPCIVVSPRRADDE